MVVPSDILSYKEHKDGHARQGQFQEDPRQSVPVAPFPSFICHCALCHPLAPLFFPPLWMPTHHPFENQPEQRLHFSVMEYSNFSPMQYEMIESRNRSVSWVYWARIQLPPSPCCCPSSEMIGSERICLPDSFARIMSAETFLVLWILTKVSSSSLSQKESIP